MKTTCNSSVVIRMALAEDAATIASLLLESFAPYRPLYTEQGFAATTPVAEQVVRRISEGPVWLAVVDQKAVGTVGALVHTDSLYVRGMAVVPTARGNGIGQKLLDVIEQYAKDQGCSRIFLSTTPFLEHAIRLYEQCGFLRTAIGPHDLCGTPLFTMEKTLY